MDNNNYRLGDDFELKKLCDVVTVNPKNESDFNDEFVYIDLESVSKGNLSKQNIISNNEKPSRAQRIINDNDILFQLVRPYQKNNYLYNSFNDLQYVASTGYAILRSNLIEDSEYIYQLINTSRFNFKVLQLCTGSNYPAITSSDLGNIEIKIHSNIEDRKNIGNLFKNIDSLINYYNKQKELLEQKKKHYLNVIFNDKNGDNYRLGERKIYKIDDISTIVSDGIHSTPKYDEDGSIPFVNGNNIKSYTIDTTNVEKYINKEEYNKYKKKYNDNSVVIALNGSIGRVGINTPSEKLFGKSIGYINCCEDIILPKYMMYYLDTNSIQNKFISSSTGSTIKNLSITEIKNIKLNIHSINKQEEIESFMFNLDSQISNYTKQKELLEQKKKHYLNVIFNDKIK